MPNVASHTLVERLLRQANEAATWNRRQYEADLRAAATRIREQQEALEKQERACCLLAGIYFDIAVSALGETEVRRRRKDALDTLLAAHQEGRDAGE